MKPRPPAKLDYNNTSSSMSSETKVHKSSSRKRGKRVHELEEKKSENILVKFYNFIKSDSVGSKSHVTHWESIPKALFTMALMSSVFVMLMRPILYPFAATWLNISIYFFAWTIYIVLFGVLTGIDWSRVGTFFELLHNCVETFFAFVSLGYVQAGFFITTASMGLQQVSIMRLDPIDQFTWAVLLGSGSHVICIILTSIAAFSPSFNPNSELVYYLLPAFMFCHFAYDLSYLISSWISPGSCQGPQPYRKQFFLVFCNLASIGICLIFLELNKDNQHEQLNSLTNDLMSFFNPTHQSNGTVNGVF